MAWAINQIKMERALKERITGAVVLVVFVVLVVPIFLDGPPSEDEIVTETVVLPGQSEQKMQTQVLDRDRDTPVPSASSKETVAAPLEARPDPEIKKEPVAAPIDARSAPETKKEPVGAPLEARPDPQPASTSTTGMWAVQLGSFSSQVNADKLAAELRKEGFAAFVSQISTDKGKLHRVRTAPQSGRAAAEAVANKLKNAGHAGQVVPHP